MKKLLGILLLPLCVQSGFAQWNNNPAVNLQISGLEASDMHSVRTPDGKTWIAYYAQMGSQYQMYAQLLDTSGAKLLGANGVPVDTFSSGSATFVFNICTDKTGNLIIGLQDQRTGAGMTTVGYRIDQSGTSLWAGDTGVVLGSGYSPYPVLLASGDVVFAWSGNDNKVNLEKVSPSGSLLWASPIAVASSAGKTTRGQLVPMSDSGFVMVFQVFNFGISSKIYAQRFDKDGNAQWTNAVQLSDEATSAARYYSITNDADTTYFGYYSSSLSNHFNSWLQRINPDGTIPYGINGAAFSDYSQFSDPQEQTTNIATNEALPYVWAVASFSDPNQSEYGVYVQKFNKTDGTRILDPNGKEVYPIDTSRYAQQGNLALKDGNPVFMVVSDVAYHIKGTVLTADGEFRLNPHDVDLSTTNATMADPKGRFVFTENAQNFCVALWTEDRNSGNFVYAQKFGLDMLDTSVQVSTVNNVPDTISQPGGTLDMAASVLPATLSQNVTWSVTNNTGQATVSAAGVVTAVADGLVWVKATSVAAPGYSDSMQIVITGQTTGIDELNKNLGLRVYPNPTSNAIHVQFSKGHPQLTLSIADLNGRVVLAKKLSKESGVSSLTINLKALSEGVYILKIQGDGVLVNRKITKQ